MQKLASEQMHKIWNRVEPRVVQAARNVWWTRFIYGTRKVPH